MVANPGESTDVRLMRQEIERRISGLEGSAMPDSAHDQSRKEGRIAELRDLLRWLTEQ